MFGKAETGFAGHSSIMKGIAMDSFQRSCDTAYEFISQKKRTTSKEIRHAGKFKVHELGDILFQLRLSYGVVSIRGKGIFLDSATYQHWLCSTGAKHVPMLKRSPTEAPQHAVTL